MRRKMKNKNVRTVHRKSGSYGVTIPIEIIKKLRIRKGQKVVVRRSGKKIIIEDWE